MLQTMTSGCKGNVKCDMVPKIILKNCNNNIRPFFLGRWQVELSSTCKRVVKNIIRTAIYISENLINIKVWVVTLQKNLLIHLHFLLVCRLYFQSIDILKVYLLQFLVRGLRLKILAVIKAKSTSKLEATKLEFANSPSQFFYVVQTQVPQDIKLH